MKYGHLVSATLAVLAAVAPTRSLAGPRETSGKEINNQQEDRETKGGAENGAVFPRDWKQYIQQRQADIIEINTHLYELNGDERAKLSAMAEKFSEGIALTNEKEPPALMKLIEMRGEIYSKYAGEKDLDERALSELSTLPEIQKYNVEIALLESSISDAASINAYCESIVGDERSAIAHSQWTERLLRAKGSIANVGLIETYAEPGLKAHSADRAKMIAVASSEREKMRTVPTVSGKRTRRRPARIEKPDEGTKSVSRRAMRKPSDRVRRGESSKPGTTADSRKPVARRKKDDSKTASRNTPKPVPLDEWEQYVRDFILQYKCTPEQSNSALSILADLKDRAERQNRGNAKKIAAAEQISDRRKRQERLDDINAPVAKLFIQLKHRLDGLLTTEQRAMKPATPIKKKN